MLKEPLVPLTRKDGFRCSRARDINMEVLRPKNGEREGRYGNFVTTNLMLGVNANAELSWSGHGRSIRPNPPRESFPLCKQFCWASTQRNQQRLVLRILEPCSRDPNGKKCERGIHQGRRTSPISRTRSGPAGPIRP